MRHQSKTGNRCAKISLFFLVSNILFTRRSYVSRLVGFFPFRDFYTKHMIIHNYCSLHSRNTCLQLSFHYFWNFHSCQDINTINSASDTSILRTCLVNHTLLLSITVHDVCDNIFFASYHSKKCCYVLSIFHISNMSFQHHVISNYFVGNCSFSIDFDRTDITDTTP